MAYTAKYTKVTEGSSYHYALEIFNSNKLVERPLGFDSKKEAVDFFSKWCLERDYTKKNDTELLTLYNDLNKNKKPVPLSLVKEIHRRKLIETYTGTYHS